MAVITLPPQYAAFCDGCGAPSGERTPQGDGVLIAYPMPFEALARARVHGFKNSPAGLLCPACQLEERERARGQAPADLSNVLPFTLPPKA
jgi:hypothetical protein